MGYFTANLIGQWTPKKNELGLNNNDYLFWQLLGSLQRECRQTFHSIIGP